MLDTLDIDHNSRGFASLVAGLRARDVLSDAERDALLAACSEFRHVRKGSDLTSEGSIVTVSTLLIDGFACRYTYVPDGGRQITALHMPGDFVDLYSLPLKRMDHSVGAITDCRVAVFPHAVLKRLGEQHPHLNRLLWMLTLIDAAIQRQWIVAKGRLGARQQLAHLFCELYARARVAGLVDARNSIPLPLTQVQLADALGVSIVHANRTLKALRAVGGFEWDGIRLTISDLARLHAEAQFDPVYLHLEQLPR